MTPEDMQKDRNLFVTETTKMWQKSVFIIAVSGS